MECKSGEIPGYCKFEYITHDKKGLRQCAKLQDLVVVIVIVVIIVIVIIVTGGN